MDRNPQAEEMAHESMLRNLAAQAEAIWPQEREILLRYGLPEMARILDVGCGPGEIAERILDLFGQASLAGVDVNPEHLERARARCARFGQRAGFHEGDAFALPFPDRTFDLALCRHLLQAVPRPEDVVAELVRVARPGGRVHIVAEDYGMMHCHPTRTDNARFWRDGPIAYGHRTGTDLESGRKIYTILVRLGLRDVRVDYVIIDPVRVPRPTFHAIWQAWRDGYSGALARNTSLLPDEIRAFWDDMLACLESEEGYAVWFLPVISGVLR